MPNPVSKPKRLTSALLSLGLATAASAQGVATTPPSPTDLLNQWAQLVVYAVTPYCQVLSNGLRVCQPIGLVGPAPGPMPSYQPLVQVPLAPPSIQPAWPPLPAMPYAGNPYLAGTGLAVTPWQPPSGTAAGAPVTASLPPAPQPQTMHLPATAATQRPDIAPSPATASGGEVTLPAAGPAAQPIATRTTPAAGTTPSSTPAAPVAAPPAPATGATPAAGETVVRVEASGSPTAQVPAGETVIAHFAFDSAQLTAAGRAALDTWLAGGAKDAKIVIIGHADRLGPAAYNKALSRRRAEAARAYLIGKGVDAGRIEIIAKGESQPVKHCKGGANPRTIACLAPNRRVEIDP